MTPSVRNSVLIQADTGVLFFSTVDAGTSAHIQAHVANQNAGHPVSPVSARLSLISPIQATNLPTRPQPSWAAKTRGVIMKGDAPVSSSAHDSSPHGSTCYRYRPHADPRSNGHATTGGETR
jgi:hypothetical protein